MIEVDRVEEDGDDGETVAADDATDSTEPSGEDESEEMLPEFEELMDERE